MTFNVEKPSSEINRPQKTKRNLKAEIKVLIAQLKSDDKMQTLIKKRELENL